MSVSVDDAASLPLPVVWGCLLLVSLAPAASTAQSDASSGDHASDPAQATSSGPRASGDKAVQLSADRAVQRAIQHPRALADAEADISIAKARGQTERTWNDPQLELLHEHLVGSEPVVDSWAIVEQTIPLAGRGALRDLGDARVAAARHSRDASRQQLARTTRQRFYRLLALQRKRRLLRAHTEWLDQRIRTLESRPEPDLEPSGDTRNAGPNANRPPPRSQNAELESLKSERLRTITQRRRAEARWARLAPLLLHDVGASPTRQLDLSGSLLPDQSPPDLDQLDTLARDHPGMKVLRNRADMARFRDASGAWPQNISVAAGFRSSYANDDFIPGYFAGVSIGLPVWSALSTGPSVERATFRKRRAAWRRRVEQKTARLVGLRAEYTELREACRQFRRQSDIDLTPLRTRTPETQSPQTDTNLQTERRQLDRRLQWIALALQTRMTYIALNGEAGTSHP